MRDINLLPGDKYNKKALAKSIIAIGFIFGIIVAVSYLMIYQPLIQRQFAEDALRLHNSQMDILRQQEAEKLRLQGEYDQLLVRMEGLSILLGEFVPGSAIIENIDMSMPAGLVLENINLIDKTLAVQGRVPSNIEVADFSSSLTDTGLFASVRILSINRLEGDASYTFEMSLLLK